jgi:hypothetical protein
VLTGLSTRTVSTATSALAGRGLVEKRSVRNRSGQHDYNLYLIQPASHIGKFDFNQRPTPTATTVAARTAASSSRPGQPGVHREKNLPTVEAMGKEPPAVNFPYVKKGSSNGGSGVDLDSQVFAPACSRQPSASSRPAECPEAPALDAKVFACFAERQGVRH